MKVSDQIPISTLPTVQVPVEQLSGTFANNNASRSVIVTQGVTEIQGPTRFEYVPYQRTVIQYQPVETIEYIPVERKIIQYQERRRIEQVPAQETVQDYYTIEHLTQYIQQIIPQKRIQYVPVEKIQNRVEYYPIERQVVYYPNQRQQFNSRQQFYQYCKQHQNYHDNFVQNKSPNVFSFNSSIHHKLYDSIQRTHHHVTTDIVKNKQFSYVSPIDFTRDNISPRVSTVSTSKYSTSNFQNKTKTNNKQQNKSNFSKKHHGSKNNY